MESNKLNASIIVCTYNRCRQLRELLYSVTQLEVADSFHWELLIVDNNSTDDTRSVVDEFARRSALPFKYIFEGQQGKSFALNTAVRHAQGEILLFTDDDVTVDNKWLVRMMDAFKDGSYVGVAGKVVAVWNSEKPNWFEDRGTFRLMPAIVSFDLGADRCELKRPAPGVNVGFRSFVFAKYGSFRTDLGPTGGSVQGGLRMAAMEDTEFCQRLLAGGEKFLYEPGAVVYHPVEAHRTTKEYFLTWYFDSGRAAVRANGIPAEVACYLRIPRYLLRQVLTSAARWACSLDERRRFYHKLDTFFVAGMMAEAYRRER
jgi:glycosyltransferase involved in cell wall biosynthesis